MEGRFKHRRFEEAAFSVLYCMVKDSELGSTLGFILLVIEDVQLLTFSWSRAFGFTPLPEIFTFEYPEHSNYAVFRALFWIFFSVVAVIISTVVYIGVCYRRGSFKAVWPVRLLRYLSTATSTLALMPMLTVFFQGIICTQNEDGDVVVKKFQEVGCFSSQHLPIFILSIVALAFMLAYAVVMSLICFEPDPRSNVPAARPHGRTDTAYVIVRVILIVTYEALGHSYSANAGKLAVALIAMVFLCGMVVIYQPFYAPHMTDIRAGIFFASAGDVIVAIGTLSSKGGSGVAAFSVLCVLTPVFFVGGYFASRYIRGRIVMGIYSRLAVAPPVRLHSRQMSGFNVRDMAAYAASGDVPELKNRWTLGNIKRVAMKEVKPTPKVFHRVTDVEIAARFLRRNRDAEAIRLAHDLFAAALQEFPKSPLLRIVHARYIAGYSGQAGAAQKQLEAAVAMRPGFDIRCLLFMEWRTLQQDKQTEGLGIDSSLSITSYIQFQMTQAGARRHHIEALRLSCQFWKAASSTSTVDHDIVFHNLHELWVSRRKAQYMYESLLSDYPKSKTNLRLYSHFLTFVCNNVEDAQEFALAADVIEDEETRMSVARSKILQRKGHRGSSEANGQPHVDGCDEGVQHHHLSQEMSLGVDSDKVGGMRMASYDRFQSESSRDCTGPRAADNFSRTAGAIDTLDGPGDCYDGQHMHVTDKEGNGHQGREGAAVVRDADEVEERGSTSGSCAVSLAEVEIAGMPNALVGGDEDDLYRAAMHGLGKRRGNGGKGSGDSSNAAGALSVNFEMHEFGNGYSEMPMLERVTLKGSYNDSRESILKRTMPANSDTHMVSVNYTSCVPEPQDRLPDLRLASAVDIGVLEDNNKAASRAESTRLGRPVPVFQGVPAQSNADNNNHNNHNNHNNNNNDEQPMRRARSTVSFASTSSREQGTQRLRRQRIESRLKKPAVRERNKGIFLWIALVGLIVAGYVLSLNAFDEQRSRLDGLKTGTRPRRIVSGFFLNARELMRHIGNKNQANYDKVCASMINDVERFETTGMQDYMIRTNTFKPRVRVLTQVQPDMPKRAAYMTSLDAMQTLLRNVRIVAATPFSVANATNMLATSELRFVLDNGLAINVAVDDEMHDRELEFDSASNTTDERNYIIMGVFLFCDVAVILFVFWPLMREISTRRARMTAVLKLVPRAQVNDMIGVLDEELQHLVALVPEEGQRDGLAQIDDTESAEALAQRQQQAALLGESSIGIHTNSTFDAVVTERSAIRKAKLKLWLRFLLCVLLAAGFAVGMFSVTFSQSKYSSGLARLMNLSNARRYRAEGISALCNELVANDLTTWTPLGARTVLDEWIAMLEQMHNDCLYGTSKTPSTFELHGLYNELVKGNVCHVDAGCDARTYTPSIGLTRDLVLLPLNRLIAHFLGLAKAYSAISGPYAFSDPPRTILSALTADIKDGLNRTDFIIINTVTDSIDNSNTVLTLLFALTLGALVVLFFWCIVATTRRFEREMVQSVRLFFDIPLPVLLSVPQLRRFIESGGNVEKKD